MNERDPAVEDTGSDPSDAALLITRASSGDRDAFRQLVHRYQNTVYRWAVVLLGDQDDADDVTQAVLIRMHAAMPRYRGAGKFTTWLYSITKNVIADQLRTGRRRAELLDEHTVVSTADGVTGTTIPDAMDASKLESLVRHCLFALPPRQREVFMLSDLEGFSPSEIAEMLDLEQVTVRTNLLKARRAVREIMWREQGKLLKEYRS
jgi:RNA polymerase sigma-70 factor (ECF subfamily)